MTQQKQSNIITPDMDALKSLNPQNLLIGLSETKYKIEEK